MGGEGGDLLGAGGSGHEQSLPGPAAGVKNYFQKSDRTLVTVR